MGRPVWTKQTVGYIHYDLTSLVTRVLLGLTAKSFTSDITKATIYKFWWEIGRIQFLMVSSTKYLINAFNSYNLHVKATTIRQPNALIEDYFFSFLALPWPVFVWICTERIGSFTHVNLAYYIIRSSNAPSYHQQGRIGDEKVLREEYRRLIEARSQQRPEIFALVAEDLRDESEAIASGQRHDVQARAVLHHVWLLQPSSWFSSSCLH